MFKNLNKIRPVHKIEDKNWLKFSAGASITFYFDKKHF